MIKEIKTYNNHIKTNYKIVI